MFMPETTRQPVPDLEDLLRRFEAAWKQSPRPNLTEFILPEGELPEPHLLELIQVDLELRIRAGADRCVEHYARHFPALCSSQVILQLVLNEYQVRARYRGLPRWEEYVDRFPDLEPELRKLSEQHQLSAYALTVGDNRPGTPILMRPTIPGLTMINELGRGGMGVVYRAQEASLGRFLAVKTLCKYPDGDTASRFKREAETIARLAHPNVIGIHGIGTWNARGVDVPFFTMPFYVGGSLDAVRCGQGGDVRQHVVWLIQVCRAVQHAHKRGVLHRDLKPSNILLDENGEAQVADFGLAGWFEANRPHEFTNEIVGTPSFMAPEQARDPRAVTTAVDIYGLGTILYYQLTGSAPFVGDTPLAILKQVENQPPVAPSSRSPGVPRDLEIVCLKCLEKQPEHRYATAAMLADDLQCWLDGRPISARPATSVERLLRLVRRHPFVSSLTGATMAALAFAVVVLLVSNREVRFQESQAKDALSKLDQSYRQQRHVLYIEQVAAAGRLLQANSLQHAWHLLDQCDPEDRDWEWHYLNRLRSAPGIVLEGHGRGTQAVAILADGRPVTVDFEGRMRFWSVDGRLENSVVTQAKTGARLSVHPDQPVCVVCHDSGAILVSAHGAPVVHPLVGSRWSSFLPDGRTLLLANDKQIDRVAWESVKPVGSPILLTHSAVSGAVSTDGFRLIVADSNHFIHVWDLATNRLIGKPWQRNVAIGDLTLVDGNKTLIECLPSQLRFTSVQSGARLHQVDDSPGRTVVASGVDDETFLASNTLNEVTLRTIAAPGTVVRAFRGHQAFITSIATSKDRTRLVTGSMDGTARLYDLKRSVEYDEISIVDDVGPVPRRMPVATPYRLRTSSDGNQVAIVPQSAPVSDEVIGVLDLSTLKFKAHVPGQSDAVFLPDGHSMAVIGRSNSLSLWDLDAHTAQVVVNRASFPTRLAVDAKGSRFAVGDVAGTVELLNAKTLQSQGVVHSISGPVYSLDWVGPYLAIGGRDSVDVLDMDQSTVLLQLVVPSSSRKTAIDLVNRRFAIAASNRPFSMHWLDDPNRTQPFVGAPGEINDLAFHPSGRRLATAGADGRIRIWDCESGRELLDLPSGHRSANGVAWSPDGQKLYALGSSLRIWCSR